MAEDKKTLRPPSAPADTPGADDSQPDEDRRRFEPSLSSQYPTLPGYELLEAKGEGGMGVVFKARQLALNRLVAIKLLRNGEWAGETTLKRFFAEAQTAAAAKHPNIVDVYDYGQIGRVPYLVMELLEGGSLSDRLKATGPLTPQAAAALVERIAGGVHAAHAKGIVHRDLKPANVLFTHAGEPKVADFGLARHQTSDLTRSVAMLGTLPYMSPEQAKGQARLVGPQADIWALGVILFECLTGQRPFRAEESIDLMMEIVSEEPESVHDLNAAVPTAFDAIIRRCLAKNPTERYTSAAELAAALNAISQPPPSPPSSTAATLDPARPTAADTPRSFGPWIAVGVLLLALLGTGAAAFWFWQQAEYAKRERAFDAREREVAARELAVTAQPPAKVEPIVPPTPSSAPAMDKPRVWKEENNNHCEGRRQNLRCRRQPRWNPIRDDRRQSDCPRLGFERSGTRDR